MATLTCLACGKITNTVCAEWMFMEENRNTEDGLPKFAKKCFAAWVDGKWVKGCGYEAADQWERWSADTVMKPIEKDTTEDLFKTEDSDE